MNTEFYFYVEQGFEGALNAWSRGFSGGRFDQNDVKRELFAVDSEFTNAQSEEQWHYQESIRKCANPKNPFSRFNMGSLSTLPLSQLQEVTSAAKHFYGAHYTADRMHLMLVCDKPLDQLQALARKHFGWYAPNPDPEPDSLEPSFASEHLGKLIWLSSQKNKSMLSLVFPIPKHLIDKFHQLQPNNKAHNFIRKLLEIPDENGFVNRLYKKNWILDFVGGQFWSEPNDQSLFQVKFLLTETGLQNSMNIVKFFYQYLNNISKIINEQQTRDYHSQLSLLSYLQFHYSNNPSTNQYLSEFNDWVFYILYI